MVRAGCSEQCIKSSVSRTACWAFLWCSGTMNLHGAWEEEIASFGFELGKCMLLTVIMGRDEVLSSKGRLSYLSRLSPMCRSIS